MILAGEGKFLSCVTTRKQVEDELYAIVGSPATVSDRLKEYIKRLGSSAICWAIPTWHLPADLTKSMTMFAQEVFRLIAAKQI